MAKAGNMQLRSRLLALAWALALAGALLAAFAGMAWAEGEADASGEAAAVAEAADEAAEPGDAGDAGDAGSSGDAGEAGAADSDDDDPANLVDPTQRADNSFIYDTTIDSLYSQASIYEGSTVQVVGEVVGDLIRNETVEEGGRDLYWIMLTATDAEDKASISVLLSAEQAKQIDHFGRYGVTGTILQVRGIYHQACDEHQGLPDIHATNSSPVARGSEHPDAFNAANFAPGLVTVLIGAVLLGVYYFVRERSR